MDCYTGMKVVKKEYPLPQILNFSVPKSFQGSLVNKTQNSSKNSKPFWRLHFRRGSVAYPPSIGKGLSDIQYSISMIIETRFHYGFIWFIMTRYCNMRQIILENATAVLSQNATEVYYKVRQVSYYKMRQFYYKMRQLLQIATILLWNATAITKCDVYYKLRRYKFFPYNFFSKVFC